MNANLLKKWYGLVNFMHGGVLNEKILIIAFVFVFLVGGFLFLNNKQSKIQMLDYRVDEVVKNFTHESVGGVNHTNNTDFQVSLSKIKELENLTFYEEQLLQDTSEIMTIIDNDIYIKR